MRCGVSSGSQISPTPHVRTSPATGSGTRTWWSVTGRSGSPSTRRTTRSLSPPLFPRCPPPLVEQLVEDGRLVQPIGRGGHEQVVLFAKRGGAPVSVRVLTGARFVRLVGTYGFADEL